VKTALRFHNRLFYPKRSSARNKPSPTPLLLLPPDFPLDKAAAAGYKL
jgi:hypothetical protein